VGSDGTPESLLAGTATVRDTTIAVIENGFVYGRHPGRTYIDIDVGDCGASIVVDVDEVVHSPSALKPFQAIAIPPLRLPAGQLRTWRIPPGPYEIAFGADDARLVLGGASLNCSQWSMGDSRYRCIAMRNASVIVRNTRAAGTSGDIVGDFYIRRPYDSDN